MKQNFSNPWLNGLFFILSDVSGGGCWSVVGRYGDKFSEFKFCTLIIFRASGYTAGLGNMADFGGPSQWQFLALDEERCLGENSATTIHELLHALGFGHEHK